MRMRPILGERRRRSPLASLAPHQPRPARHAAHALERGGVAAGQSRGVHEGARASESDTARGREAATAAEACRTAADPHARESSSSSDLSLAPPSTRAAERTARAQLEAARAEVASRELDLQFTRLTAPEAGRVTTKTVEQGMFVQVGQSLMAIVTHDLWVNANFKDTQLGEMRPGQPVVVRVDAFPGRVSARTSTASSAAPARGSPCCRPRTPPATSRSRPGACRSRSCSTSRPTRGYPLGPGMSVVPTVRVK